MSVALPSFSVLLTRNVRLSVVLWWPRSVAVTTSVWRPSGSLSNGILTCEDAFWAEDGMTVEPHRDGRRAGGVGGDHVGLGIGVLLDLVEPVDGELGRRGVDHQGAPQEAGVAGPVGGGDGDRGGPVGDRRGRARSGRRRPLGPARGACRRWPPPLAPGSLVPASGSGLVVTTEPARTACTAMRGRHRVDREAPALGESRAQDVGGACRKADGVAALREMPGRKVEAVGGAAHAEGHVASVEAHGEAVQVLGAGHVDRDDASSRGPGRSRGSESPPRCGER